MIDQLGVLVLAAGMSSRAANIAGGKPKPLLELDGMSVLERNLRWLEAEGVRSLWINLHYEADAIRNALGSGERLGMKISYVYEPELLGTAGAYKILEAHWGGTVLVVYGDSLVRFDLCPFVQTHRASGAVATVGLFDQSSHPNTSVAGGRVAMDSTGRISGFVEGADAAYSTLVNAGAYLLEPPVLAMIPDSTFYDFGKDLFPRMLENNLHLQGHVIDGYCLGIDTPESFALAQRLVHDGKVRLS